MNSVKNSEYAEFIKNDKIITHTVNGISRFLILWIIKHYGPIHGYNISKEFSDIFESLMLSNASPLSKKGGAFAFFLYFCQL